MCKYASLTVPSKLENLKLNAAHQRPLTFCLNLCWPLDFFFFHFLSTKARKRSTKLDLQQSKSRLSEFDSFPSRFSTLKPIPYRRRQWTDFSGWMTSVTPILGQRFLQWDNYCIWFTCSAIDFMWLDEMITKCGNFIRQFSEVFHFKHFPHLNTIFLRAHCTLGRREIKWNCGSWVLFQAGLHPFLAFFNVNIRQITMIYPEIIFNVRANLS